MLRSIRGFFIGDTLMQKIKLTNVKAGGSFKLPGGLRVKKGKSVTVPASMLTHRSIRHQMSRGRLAVTTIGGSIEVITDNLIEEGREKIDDVVDMALDVVDPFLDTSAARAVVDSVLDKVEDTIENVVDNAIDAAEDAVSEVVEDISEAVSDVVGDVVEGISDMLGFGDKEEKKEEAPKPKRRRSRKKKSDS